MKNNRPSIAILASLLLQSACSTRLSLYDASLSVDNLVVSKLSTGKITMTRLDGTRAGQWEKNKCFELFVESPYKDFDSYRPFNKDTGIACSSPNDKVKVDCKIKEGSSFTLQFWFSELPEEYAADQVRQVSFTNFHTPWSGQTLRNVKIRYYSDLECTRAQRQKQLPAITIQPEAILGNSVKVTSTSDVLGYRAEDNEL